MLRVSDCCRLLAVAACIVTGSAASAQLAGLFANLAGGANAAPADPVIKTGRVRLVNAKVPGWGQATEIEDGAAITADFSTGTASIYGARMPVAIYAFAGTAGQTVTVRASSPDVHLQMWITRTMAGVMGRSQAPVAGGPREASVSATIKQDGPHYVIIYGLNTKANGKLDGGTFASVGRYTVSVGESSGAAPVVAATARTALSGTAPASPAAGNPAANSLETTYARLCSDDAAAGNETCTALKQAMIAKLTGKTAAAASAPTQPAKARLGPGRTSRTGTAARPAASLAKSSAAAASAPPPLDPAAWAVSEAALAMPASSYTRSFTTPAGRNTNFEVKLPAGQPLEVFVDMNGISGLVYACFIPNALLGSSEGFCPLAHNFVVKKGVAVARFRQDRPGEVQVKITNTNGPRDASYRVMTRPDLPGRGAALLTRLERLAGRNFVSEGAGEDGVVQQFVLNYRIVEPGRSGIMTARNETGKTTEARFALTPNGDLAAETETDKGSASIGADGLFWINYRGGRFGYDIDADGNLVRQYMPRTNWGALRGESAADLGSFIGATAQRFAPLPDAAVSSLLARGPQRIEAVKAARLLDWGSLGRMAGRTWMVGTSNGGQIIGQYAWESEGYILTAQYWTAENYGIAAPYGKTRLIRDPVSGTIAGAFVAGTASTPMAASLNAVGDSIYAVGSNKSVLSFATPNDVLAEPVGGSTPAARYQAVDKLQLASIAQNARTLQAQRQAQAAAAQQNSGGGGLLGFLNQATQAYTLATNPQAYQAAVMGKMNELAPGLGDAMQIVAGNGGGGIAPGAGGQAAAGRASYPTRGNLALGPQCPGFTTENYQSRSTQGGGDTQLFTMCAQAFHLYKQYLNAIAQGYSEADANRTYDAHSKASQVAGNFYATAR